MILNTKNDVEKSLTDYAFLVSSRVLKILIAAITVPIVTRVLGPEGYGQLNLFYMIGSVGLTFLIFWLITPVVRFGKEEYAGTGKINETFWSLNILLFIAAIIGSVLIIIFREKISIFIGIGKSRIFIYVLMYYVFGAFLEYVNRILTATGRIEKSAYLEVLPKVLFFIPLIYLFAIGAGNVQVLLFLVIATQFISLILAKGWIPMKMVLPVKINTRRLREMFSFAYPFFFSATAAYIVNYIDLIVIRKYLPLSEVGVYSLSYNMAIYIKSMIMAVVVVSTPIIIGFYTENREDLLKKYVKRFVPQGVFAWSLVLCFSMVLMPLVIPVFFEESFSGSISPVQILLFGLLINGIATFYSGILISYKAVQKIMLVSISIAVVNLIGDLWLVPVMGINGAALSSAVAFATGGIGYMFYGNRCLKIKEFKSLVFVLPLIYVYYTVVNGYYLLVPAVILIYYVIVKKVKIFMKEDAVILDYIKLPNILDRFFRWTYNKLGA